MTLLEQAYRFMLYGSDHAKTLALLDSVENEVKEQFLKWGEQNHPLVADHEDVAYYNAIANSSKRVNDEHAEAGTLGWDGVLLEEVYEALAEEDPEKAITELVQVAAVAVSAAKSILRNGVKGRK